MDNEEKKISESVDKLIAFGQEHDYLSAAFYSVFGKRLYERGYTDGNLVLGAVVKGTYYSRLNGSALQKLFSKNCVVSKNIDIMTGFLENMISDTDVTTDLEKEALVFWIFLPYINSSQREFRKKYLLKALEGFLEMWTRKEDEELFDEDYETVKYTLRETQGIIYISELCSVEVVDSVEEYIHITGAIKRENADRLLFYRGHSWIDYLLLPGIKRRDSWLKNESVMYQEMLVRCAQDFMYCETHLDYLVEMQHYGLPTRLLDITENPLVALYFACCSNLDKIGEVILMNTEPRNLKYAKSDTASILAALPTLSYEKQNSLYRLCKNRKRETADPDYRNLSGILAAEIKSKNPAFEPNIKKKDLLGQVFITPRRNNQRIMKQEGSFIICGLSKKIGESGSLNSLRCREKNGKRIVLAINKKNEILEALDTLSINRASLFPEIDDVAEYIRQKYV